MHYIVVDFEWNQPISWQSSVYKEFGDKLVFEMIQIGAVKLGEDMKPVDSISIPIAPTCYIRINPRIRKMTGLGPDELAGAPSFNEAMAQFAEWCGEDYILMTWGCDDVSVLKQNMDFFSCSVQLSPLYDIQRMFSDVRGVKERKGLKTAMELAGIEEEEDRTFHNALHDAWYTAKVFASLPEPESILKYIQKPKALNRTRHHSREKTQGEVFDSIEEALESETALKPVCPRCKKPFEPDGPYVSQSEGRYVNVGRCKSHGAQLIRLRIREDDESKFILHRTVSPANGNDVAYIHTKMLMIQREKEGKEVSP